MKIAWDRVVNMTLWVLQAFLALVFLLSGAAKFSPYGNFWMDLFAKIGIGQWFRYFTGGLEIICAVFLMIPRTSAVAAALLACTMAGATFTHLCILRDGYAAMFPGLALVILVVIAWKRGLKFHAVNQN